MSRGRGGPYKEHYCRQPPSHLQAKENHYRPGPATDFPRAGPQQVSHPNYYESVHPGAPVQPPGPLIPNSPNSSYSQNHSGTLSPNSFQYKQAAFLRGQSSEAPHFHGHPHRGGLFVPGRPEGPGYQPQSGCSNYPNPSSGPRGRGGYRQNLNFAHPHAAEPPRGRYFPQHPNPNQHYDRQWGVKTDSVSDNFQRLCLQDRPSKGPKKFSSSSGFKKVDIKLTPDIQDQVLRALVALKPDERIPARVLAKKLRLPKRIVNRSLYTLEQLQQASKQGQTPPEWSLYRKHIAGENQQLSEARDSSSEGPGTPEVEVEPETETRVKVEPRTPEVGVEPETETRVKVEPRTPEVEVEPETETRVKVEPRTPEVEVEPETETRVKVEPRTPEVEVEPETETRVKVEPRTPEVEVEPETETRVKVEEEGFDTEFHSYSSSLSESSDSEEYQPPPNQRHPSPTSSPDPELTVGMMSDQKELVLQYLLESGEATALVIAKNLGLKNTKRVNPTLYALEKQGDITKNGEVNPPTWELSTRRKDRMERRLKAAQSIAKAEVPMEGEASSNNQGGGSTFVIPGLEPVLEDGTPKQSHNEAKPLFTSCKNKETNEGQWATDDIPEFLNAIRRETDADKLTAEKSNAIGTVAVSVAAPPPQNLWAKLQEVRLKNPVSGLMEYAQYLGHNCEFLLLDQSGPSHDPRFRMQVMLNGRLFPIVEASSKKVAKKDAAAATLRILVGEMQGGTSTGDEGQATTGDQPTELLADPSGAVENTGATLGSISVEGMTEGPRQLLSRSLPGGKNPVSVLMEYSQRSGKPIEFIITGQAGPPHDPRFMYRVKVGESLFAEASAPSKKAARQLAAEEAVKELMADGRLQLNKPQLPLGTSSDGDLGASGTCATLPPLTADELRAAHEAGVGDLINHLNNNAVSGLLEYARARGFAAEIRLVGQSGPPHEPKFTYQAKLGGRWFPPVCASNKKQGKHEAADAALRVLIGEAERAARTGELIPAELPVSGSTLHDQIAMLSHQRFNALTTRIQHSLLGRKILATIVMRRGEGLGTVVSLGTGNRCVKGEELSLKGETVNDCHAEIISRRGFVRFLYIELLKHYDGGDDSIFESTQDNRLRVKSDITFHLYISTAPCGDGALFDKSCSEAGDEVEGHQPLFENAKQGKLRTKVENGEGTIPVESSAIVPTWDGIQHGERLRTMSCSDKILRWNVMGLQGALLTHFLDPIYLKSITLGYLYSHGHLTRAVCCRLARDGEAFTQNLPPPFKLNHPEVGRVSVYDSTRHTGKTKESSVNWSFPDQHCVEVLDGTKGKQDGNKLAVSRVSKSHLFGMFRALCQRCGRADLLSLPSYAQAKISAASFQSVKRQFFEALNVHGYGAWIGKPLEEKSFEAGEGTVNNAAGISVGFSRNGGATEFKQEEA